MRHRTLFLLFAGLLLFFVLVQFPLWMMAANRHSSHFDSRSYPRALSLEEPPQQRTTRSDQHTNKPTGIHHVVAPGVIMHPVPNASVSACPSRHSTVVVVHALAVQSAASFPWHVLLALSAVADGTGGNEILHCVVVVLVTSIRSEQYAEALEDVEFSDMLTAVGWDPATLTTVACPHCMPITLRLVSCHDAHGVVLRPLDAQRAAWKYVPAVTHASIGPQALSHNAVLAYFSPAVDISTIPWRDVLLRCAAHSGTPGLEAFTIVDPEENAVVSAGLSAALASDEVVLAWDYAGYSSADLRPQVAERSVLSAAPDAFIADLRFIDNYWPRSVGPIAWEEQRSHQIGKVQFCVPEQLPFVHFLLSCAESGVPAMSNGIRIDLIADLTCTAALSEPLSDGGVPLSSLYKAVGLPSSRASSLAAVLANNLTTHRRTKEVMVEWDTFCVPCFGFTNEVMQFLVPLEPRLNIHSLNDPSCFCKGTPKAFQESLSRIASEKPFKSAWRDAKLSASSVANVSSAPPTLRPVLIHVSHKDPGSFPSFPSSQRPDIVIGRAMYEFTKVPRAWVSHKDQVDEIWVPCRFVKWVFERAGFPSHRLVIVPEPIDVFQYDPAAVDVLPLPPTDRFWKQASNMDVNVSTEPRTSFLSVFKLEDRKGWGELLLAYMEAFVPSDAISLYLVTYIYGEPRNADHVLAKIRTFVEANGYHWDSVPHLHVIAEELSELEMMRMYRSVDAFVLPTKGEGWGLPAIQAMSMGVPTIVSNWSGVVDFATEDNAFLIPVTIEEVPITSPYGWDNGKLWGMPSVEAMVAAMRSIVRNGTEARARGARARRDVIAQFSGEAVAELVSQRIATLEANFRAPQVERVRDTIDTLLQDHHLIV